MIPWLNSLKSVVVQCIFCRLIQNCIIFMVLLWSKRWTQIKLYIFIWITTFDEKVGWKFAASLLQNIFCFIEQRRLQIVFSAEFSVEISLFIKTLFAFSKKFVEIYVTTAPWNSSSRRNRIEILFTRGVLYDTYIL